MLEDLLWRHVLRPARKSHLNSLQPRDIRSPDIPAGLTETLLAPLTQDFALHTSAKLRALHSATYLWSIATQEPTKLKPNRSRNETAWLEILFCHVAHRSGMFEYHEPNDEQQMMLVSITEAILNNAVQAQVQLKPATLEKVHKRLFRVPWAFADVEWNLLSSCMMLDATIFVDGPVSTFANGQLSPHVPNELLLLLFKRMDEIGYKATLIDVKRGSRSPNDVIYQSLFPKILAPLAKAFIQLRDFPGFITLWEQELCRNYLSGRNGRKMTIWEDDELLHTIGQLIESALTDEKIDQFLCRALEAFECLVGSSGFGSDGPEKKIALLVTLECLLLGCVSDRYLENLEKRVVVIYQLLLKLVAESIERPKNFNTRCWRVLALINDKWSPSQHLLELERGALCKAVRVILRVRDIEVPRYDYSQEFQAFRFMLSLAKVEETRLDALPEDEFDEYYWFGDALESILYHSKDGRELAPHFFSNVEWSGQDDFIVTKPDFGLACSAQVVAVPRKLRLVHLETTQVY